MLDEKKNTLHFDALSLLPLKMALINAEKESPPRAPKRQLDMNEELALKLIRRMKKQYRKAHVIASRRLLAAKQSPHDGGDCFGLSPSQ